MVANHFARSIFVQDLAGLLVVPICNLCSLVARQDAESIRRKLRLKRERLVSGNDGVSAKQRREPRDASGNDAFPTIRNQQRVKVTGRGGEHIAEYFVA